MNPISAVATGVGSLASLFQGKQNRQLEAQQFNNDLTKGILANRYAQQQAKTDQKAQDKSEKKTILKGVLIFVAVLIFVLVWTLTKNDKK